MQANRSFGSCLVQGAKGCWGLLLGYSPTSSLPLPHRSLTCIQSQPAFLPPNLYYMSISPMWVFSVLWAMCLLYSSKFFLLPLSTQGYPIPFHSSFLLATNADRHKVSSFGTLPALFSLKILHVLCIRKASPIPIQPFHCVFLSIRLQLTFLSFSAHI